MQRGIQRTVGPLVFVAAFVFAVSVSLAVVRSTEPPPPSPSARSEGQVAGGPSPSLTSATPSPVTAPPASPPPSIAPSSVPAPTATPTPIRRAVDVNIEHHPKAVFKTEVINTWCAAAAVQMTLNVIGPSVDISTAREKAIHLMEVANTTRADSRDGGVGPLGMVATLNKLGSVRYELRIYRTRALALRDAARAISITRHPVILMAWYGAHAWVMTGYRADADPRVFANANVAGAYILDAWYPRVSSIWGRSDPPGTYQDAAEMKRNYLPWKRPEAHYPGRDGRFLALLPVAAPSN